MDSIRVTAKTVADAITEASIELGTSSENIEYTVIDAGSKGFFGLGGRKAVIEAKKKFTDEDLMKEVFGEKTEKPKKEFKKEVKKEPAKKEPVKNEVKREPRREYKKPTFEERKAAIKEHERQEAVSEEKQKKAAKPAPAEVKVPAEPKTPVEPKKPQVPAEPKAPAEPRVPRVPADPEEAKRRAVAFLTDMFRVMNMNVEIKAEFEDETLSVDLAGDEMGILIGKRGQTLDSLQYLTSLVVNKGKASYVRVKLDTEDYRNRRKATLENLAKNIAFKVKKTRKPVFLEPMNPYERRIIHSALQNDPYVTTHSEGDEPCRKVVVTPRRRNERPAYREYNRTENRQETRQEVNKEQ